MSTCGFSSTLGDLNEAYCKLSQMNTVNSISKEIKNKYGGHIYNKSKANAYKYQLSTKKGLIKLINGKRRYM